MYALISEQVPPSSSSSSSFLVNFLSACCRMASALASVMKRVRHPDSAVQIQALTVSVYALSIDCACGDFLHLCMW